MYSAREVSECTKRRWGGYLLIRIEYLRQQFECFVGFPFLLSLFCFLKLALTSIFPLDMLCIGILNTHERIFNR